MFLVCPKCSREITGQDVNIAAAIAKCSNCYAVFSVNGSQVHGETQLSFPRPLVPKPAHLTVDDSGHDLKIWFGWFHWGLLFLAIFCILWNGFLVVWYSIAIGGLFFAPGGKGDDGFWIMLVFPVLHVAVGVFLGYTTLAGFVNSTSIEVSGDMLSVRHGPLPWFGNIDLEVKSIDQLFCVDTNRPGALPQYRPVRWGRQGYSADSYDLVASLTDGTTQVLLSGQTDANVVWYLEQTLEKKLKIEDSRVPGEYVG